MINSVPVYIPIHFGGLNPSVLVPFMVDHKTQVDLFAFGKCLSVAQPYLLGGVGCMFGAGGGESASYGISFKGLGG